jgi:hypothetical protein
MILTLVTNSFIKTCMFCHGILTRGRLSAVDLQVLISLDMSAFDSETIIVIFPKQPSLMMRSTVLSLPLQIEFPGLTSVIFYHRTACYPYWPNCKDTHKGSLTKRLCMVVLLVLTSFDQLIYIENIIYHLYSTTS